MYAWLPNAIGLAGMICLALPAISADRAARRLSKIQHAGRHPDTDDVIKEIREEVLSHTRFSWSPWHSGLLYAGYLLLLASYLVRFL